MARIVQIRRGTSEQIDNFTGMEGEVTYDTTAKTLRVHDGVTLGGFALARADACVAGPIGGGDFDIDSVSDEFWAEKFAQFSNAGINIATGRIIALTAAARFEYIFNIKDVTPIMARAVLICQSAAAGYATGDEVASFGVGAHNVPPLNTFSDQSGVHAVLLAGENDFWVYHKTTGAITTINNADWGLQFRLYY